MENELGEVSINKVVGMNQNQQKKGLIKKVFMIIFILMLVSISYLVGFLFNKNLNTNNAQAVVGKWSSSNASEFYEFIFSKIDINDKVMEIIMDLIKTEEYASEITFTKEGEMYLSKNGVSVGIGNATYSIIDNDTISIKYELNGVQILGFGADNVYVRVDMDYHIDGEDLVLGIGKYNFKMHRK